MAHPIVILHLSDLHFGKDSRFAGEDRTQLGQRLAKAIQEELRERQPTIAKPDCIIVTGDIAQSAQKDEYAQARLFFDGLNATLAVDRLRYIFMPGNHDVSWSACKRIQAGLEDDEFPKSELDQRMAEAKFRRFEDFVKEFLGRPRAELGQALPGGGLVFDMPEIRLSIAALNSCEKETHIRHVPELSKEQAQALMDHWRQATYRDSLKIVAIHHNPVATTTGNIAEWPAFLDAAHKKGELEEDMLDRFVADATGLEGKAFLERIAEQCEVQLFLHGHHHAHAQAMWPWKNGRPGHSHVLSAGSLGLRPDKLPKDQPNEIQLIVLDPDRATLHAFFRVFNPLAQADGHVTPGQFVPDNAMLNGYANTLSLPEGFERSTPAEPRQPAAPDIAAFFREYRTRLAGLYAQWDLKNVGVTQAGGAGRPIDVTLEEMFLPVRLAMGYDIEKLDRGEPLDPEALLDLTAPLVIRGAAGSGKTTWMRWMFRQLLKFEQALPVMIELRRLVRLWNTAQAKGEERSLDAYIKDWAAEHLGLGWQAQILDAMKLDVGPRPVLLVDGWDELGEFGEELRSRLIGFMRSHKHLLVIVSSRPYGQDRPSGSDGFAVLDIQPLNDSEIRTLATHFFQLCYGEERQSAEESLKGFMEALERSPDAAALARTALLLTMMLLISRSSPLPEKRHQLYQKCIENLLTALPERYERDGVQRTLEQWRPENGEERLRAVASLAAQMQEQGYRDKRRQAIVLSAVEMASLLPAEWQQRHKEGFLAWLAERAGLLVDRADGTYAFAHLSFQEYLTAWRFNTTIEGDEQRIAAFKEKCEDTNWWETLRLWAALIDAANPAWLKAALDALIQGGEDAYFLASTMLADGLGAEEALDAWSERLVASMASRWPQRAELAAQAWSASRQGDRKQRLHSTIAQHIDGIHWLHFARCDAWAEKALARRLPAPRSSPAARAIATITAQATLDAHTFAAGKVLCGGHPAWPGGVVGLLNAWPGHRRLAGLRLQALANLLADRPIILAAARTALPLAALDEETERQMLDLCHHLSRDLSGELSLDACRNLSRDFCREFCRSLAIVISRYFSGLMCGFLSSDSSLDLSRNLRSALSRYLSQYLSCHLPLYLFRYFARDFSRGFPRHFPLDFRGDLLRDFIGAFLPGHVELENARWVIDFAATECYSHGRVALPAVLAAIDGPHKDPPLSIMAPACRLYHHPEEAPERFEEALAAYPADGDPLWPALARRIARRSTPEEEAILKDLARNPEAPQHPSNKAYRARATKDGMPADLQEIIWGLKYIVRGDLLLHDGSEITLDALADELRIAPPPYIEPMPEHFEIPEGEEAPNA